MVYPYRTIDKSQIFVCTACNSKRMITIQLHSVSNVYISSNTSYEHQHQRPITYIIQGGMQSFFDCVSSDLNHEVLSALRVN
jgi:hypothetical protein